MRLTGSYGNRRSNEHVGHLTFFEVSSTNRGMHVFIGLQKAQIETDNNTFCGKYLPRALWPGEKVIDLCTVVSRLSTHSFKYAS